MWKNLQMTDVQEKFVSRWIIGHTKTVFYIYSFSSWNKKAMASVNMYLLEHPWRVLVIGVFYGRNLRGTRSLPKTEGATHWLVLRGRPECSDSWQSAVFCSQSLGMIHTKLQWDDSARLPLKWRKRNDSGEREMEEWQWRKRNHSGEGEKLLFQSFIWEQAFGKKVNVGSIRHPDVFIHKYNIWKHLDSKCEGLCYSTRVALWDKL